MSGIDFDRVTKTFDLPSGEFTAVGGVSLSVADQEFVAVVGPSGCGKTTLLRLAAGLDTPTSGKVSVAGVEVAGPGPDRAVVFQQFALFPWKTVRDNIAFGLKCRGASRAEQNEAVERYLKLMGLEGTAGSYPHQLSGGMQQRVAIARSYAIDPRVLLMDEPFGALDAQTRTIMQEELVRITRVSPRTVLFITHAVEEAVYLADRVVVMGRNPGRIAEIVDVAPIRKAERWDDQPIEAVMDMPSFTHLRARLWRLLREQLEGRNE
jgi:NitT/TauT family transport system ATP-binding protein